MRSASSSRRSFVILRSLQELGLHRRDPGVSLPEHGRLAGDVGLLGQPPLVGFDLLGEGRPELLLPLRGLHQLRPNSFELSLELIELARVDGGRCGFGRRRRRRGVEVEPNERSIHRLSVELRRDRSLALAAALKLRTQAGAEAPSVSTSFWSFSSDFSFVGFGLAAMASPRRSQLEDLVEVQEGGAQNDQEHRREDEQDGREEHLDRGLHGPLLRGRLTAHTSVGGLDSQDPAE